MRRFLLVLLIALGTLGTALGAAADGQDSKKWENRRVLTIRVQDLHSTVRTGLFCEYAKPNVDRLQAGEQLLVLETRTATCGFFLRQTYLRVKRLRPDIPSDKSEGLIRVEPSQDKVRIIPD